LESCKQKAILTDIEPRVVPDFSDRKGIWVFAEQRQSKLMKVSLELLGEAQRLGKELKEEVSALLLGHDLAGLSDELIKFGAQKVYLVRHRALKEYRTLAYSKVLVELVERYKPNILLIGATHIGRDLAPRVSRSVGSGLTADCTELRIDPDEGILLQTRPAFGGNVMATIVNRYSRPQMATVRPGIMEPKKKPENIGRVITSKVSLLEKDVGTKILENIKMKQGSIDLSDAKIIVAGGRGVGNAEGFKILEKLADVMGGQVAGTRVAVEEGWVPAQCQVGQTGQSVRPEIYIACGVSGAIQHRAGMLGSRYIIAINKDPRAPIFQVADWGIVGDLHEVIPKMTQKLRKAQK
jgi:electron transfer flavoprotein alpha subunit